MSFNFGQFIGSINDIDNYAQQISVRKGQISPLQGPSAEWVIPFLYTEDEVFPTGDFVLNGLIQPCVGKQLKVKIISTTTDNQRIEISEYIIKEAERYQSSISTIGAEIVIATNNYNNCKNTYDTLKMVEGSKKQYHDYVEEDWETNWKDKPDSDQKAAAYNDYLKAEKDYDEYLQNLEAAYAAYQEAETQLRDLTTEYSEILSEIRVPFYKNFSIPTSTYQDIQVEIISMDASDIDCPQCEIEIFQLKELLNEHIMHNPLKHIAVQTVAGTKVFINKKELIVGSNNLLEIYNKNLLITSLKILPQSNFVIDYQY